MLFSGGQDSTTCLAWALDKFDYVETVGFDYGQRHAVELECRQVVLDLMRRRFPNWSEKLGSDHCLRIPVLGEISNTALTKDVEIEMLQSGLPSTFVPGRNLLFLTLAAAVGYRRNLDVLVGGMCETDFSGYPDCRDNTLKALQLALSLGMDKPLVIETPLMWIDKKGTWLLARKLGGKPLLEIVREYTHTCYKGDRSNRHPWGFGCADCPACELRAKGYEQFVKEAA